MNNRVRNMVLTAVMAAVLCVLSQISIPLPSGVPVTLQTLAVALCGFMLGPKLGTVCVLVYLALGAAGLPVFSSFGAGIGKILGVTGGFLIGFVPMAALCGLGARVRGRWARVLIVAGGLALCHLVGAAQFALVSGVSLGQGLVVASLPYLIKDAASVLAAWLLNLAVQSRLKLTRS